jgi:signal transduction histidine kinase
VTDHGRGLASDDLESIFDEFERGALAEDDGGTGLGLASVRQLVTLQRGKVSIDSELGVGTTVTVELPLPPTP